MRLHGLLATVCKLQGTVLVFGKDFDQNDIGDREPGILRLLRHGQLDSHRGDASYDRTVGYARRVMPEGRWGAPELVARFSHVDLDGGSIQGGKFDKTYLGINWWATRRWKVGFGWGHTWLDRSGTTGITDIFLTRLQWVY